MTKAMDEKTHHRKFRISIANVAHNGMSFNLNWLIRLGKNNDISIKTPSKIKYRLFHLLIIYDYEALGNIMMTFLTFSAVRGPEK